MIKGVETEMGKCLCVYVSVYGYVSLSGCVSQCVFLSLSVDHSLFFSVCVSVGLFVCMSLSV